MYLSAEVPPGGNKVFVQFDRGCITACGCTCKPDGWCSHVLALILARIRKANTSALVVHPPLSETFSQFSRDQLQKLLQYVVEKRHLELVPVVQDISSQLQDASSEISTLPGAPGIRVAWLHLPFYLLLFIGMGCFSTIHWAFMFPDVNNLLHIMYSISILL